MVVVVVEEAEWAAGGGYAAARTFGVVGGREGGVDGDEAERVQRCTDGCRDGGQGFSVLLLMIACFHSLPNFSPAATSLIRRSDDVFRASPQL